MEKNPRNTLLDRKKNKTVASATNLGIISQSPKQTVSVDSGDDLGNHHFALHPLEVPDEARTSKKPSRANIFHQQKYSYGNSTSIDLGAM